MKLIVYILLILSLAALLVPSAAWEIRGNIYSIEDGIIQWNTDNFAGFSSSGSEALQLNITGGMIKAGAAEYQSSIQDLPFKHKAWGSYSTLCFLGKDYLAGYPEDCQISEPLSLLAESGRLATVLIDSDISYTIGDTQPLPLKEGYSLRLSDADDGIAVSLYKGVTLVDSKVMAPPADYIYRGAIGDQNATCIAVSVKANVRLKPESYYTIKGIFQVSQEAIPIQAGKKYGRMIIDSAAENEIKLTNPDAISLSNGQDFELLDGFYIKTSSTGSSSDLLYIYRNATESDTPVIRGEIFAGDLFQTSWTPKNFAGFYYDFDRDMGSETITASPIESRLEEPNGVTYTTTAHMKEFEFNDWGHYYYMAFLGESYASGYANDSTLGLSSEESNLLVSERLGRVLIDSKEPRIIDEGANLTLEEGLQAKIYVDQSCSKALIEIFSDGELLDRNYMDLPNTYVYRENIAGDAKIAILAIHIADTNCTPSDSCLVDGVFQISRDLVDVSMDLYFGNLRIADVTSDTIAMDNRDRTIRLNKGAETVLAGDYYLKTIDDQPYKYCIIKPVLNLSVESDP